MENLMFGLKYIFAIVGYSVFLGILLASIPVFLVVLGAKEVLYCNRLVSLFRICGRVSSGSRGN